MGNELDFEKENALFLSKFEELSGKIDVVISQNKTLRKKVLGLEFENEKLTKEIIEVRKTNRRLKESLASKPENIDSLNILIDQNFKIQNKILRIVSDIDNKVIVHKDLKEILELLIEEIDDCISQLEK
jgi:predicted  nucleic acid-binding Zn-ribbon protein